MALGVSLATVGVSATVSIVTSYFGTLINYGRLRNRHRRVFGLSLLAEIKSIQRRFRRHRQRLEAALGTFPQAPPKLVFSSNDTSVFNNGSGSLGLFSTRTVVEVLEYYGAIRALAAEADALSEEAVVAVAQKLCTAIDEHLRMIRLARHHSRVVVVLLRRDIPMTSAETLRFCARWGTRAARRLRQAASRWAARGGIRNSNPTTPYGSNGQVTTTV
jgi:hypothetical protein